MTGRRTAQINSFIHYHYFKTMMISGLIKSTVGTLIISAGVYLCLNSLGQPDNYVWYAPHLGIVAIMVGFLVYFIGDLYKIYQERKADEKRRKEYEETLEDKLQIVTDLEEKLCQEINQLKKCKNTGDCREDGFCQKYED